MREERNPKRRRETYQDEFRLVDLGMSGPHFCDKTGVNVRFNLVTFNLMTNVGHFYNV